MAEDLVVLLQGTEIGRLARTKNGARFVFDETLSGAHAGSPLLSCALPVQDAPFDAAATASWFSGLLPEDSRLDEIRRFFAISGTSYLDVLEEVGWECAGAVSIIPSSKLLEHHDAEGAEAISAQSLAERLNALPSHPFDTAKTLRISLGGFQEKLCVVASDIEMERGLARFNTIGIPVNGSPTTHILKPQPRRFPGLVRAEAWGMAAGSCVTPTAQAAILVSDEAEMPETLVVTRFDRRLVNGRVYRIHQEDCCQALGLPPNRKYAAESSPKKSDPSFSKIASLLRQYALDASNQIETLLRQLVVNVALGNTDAHAKNYALLHEEDTVCRSPPSMTSCPPSRSRRRRLSWACA